MDAWAQAKSQDREALFTETAAVKGITPEIVEKDFSIEQGEVTPTMKIRRNRVLENYRAAHAIAVRDSQGAANTEDLRQGMVHYRALFEELLDRSVREEVRR